MTQVKKKLYQNTHKSLEIQYSVSADIFCK